MTKFTHISLLSIILVFFGCDNEDILPENEFSEAYTLSDFNLSDDYIYWEIRRGNIHLENGTNHEVLAKFDDNIFATLTQEQLNLLNEADTNNGFDSQCAPAYCPVYGVALLNDSLFIIESSTDLIDFFGDMDTEAELAWFLSVDYSTPKYYKKNDLGYRVVIEWDNLCGTKGENLIQVNTDGTTELIKELSVEYYDGCV